MNEKHIERRNKMSDKKILKLIKRFIYRPHADIIFTVSDGEISKINSKVIKCEQRIFMVNKNKYNWNALLKCICV